VIRKALLLTLMSGSLAACATALPETAELRPAPAAWTENARPITAQVEDRWWLAFDDPVLNTILARADEADENLLTRSRLEEAAARLGAVRSRLAPDLSIAGSAQRQTVDDLEQNQLSTLLNLIWSPDLNGALSARRNAASAGLSVEGARAAATRQAVRATAVRLYIAHGEALARERAALASVAALEESLELAASRERAGLASGLDPVSAQAQLAAARVAPKSAREAADNARLGLEALLGLSPGDLALQLAGGRALKTPDPARPLLSPVAVLSGRPDLIAAEQALVAAGFEASAARRDFWPSLSLSGALGAFEVDPDTPFLVSGGLLRTSAQLGAPLFSFGRLESARDAADARRTQSALAYRKAAAEAIAEVEQALNAGRSALARLTALETASAAGRDRAALASSRYRAGLEPILTVLAAQDALAQADSALASARGDVARAHTALSVAMGLGAR